MADKRSRNPKMNEFDLALTLECIHSIEVLIVTPNLESRNKESSEVTPTDERAEKLLMFLIPVLISYLLVQDENNEPNSTWKEKLGEFSLKKVTEIGQRWPHQFRQVFLFWLRNHFTLNSYYTTELKLKLFHFSFLRLLDFIEARKRKFEIQIRSSCTN